MAAGEMRSLVCTAENRGAAERSRDRTKAAACACEQEGPKAWRGCANGIRGRVLGGLICDSNVRVRVHLNWHTVGFHCGQTLV